MHLPRSKMANGRVFRFLLVLIALLAAFMTAAKAQEAPMLAERVANGDLPPVAERLPENPLVVEPVERIGQYGGTWRTVLLGGTDGNHIRRTIGYEGLLRWNPEWDEIIPNVAESFEASDDATEFTFHLRRGVRWSDGEPFTADDIVFWYEAITLNEELTPVIPSWLMTGEEDVPGTVEKIDDYTVTFRFAEPNGFFLLQIAGGGGTEATSYPRHYYEQFHIDYNPKGLDALMAAEGVSNWVDLFAAKGFGAEHSTEFWQNPDRPLLTGWVPVTPYVGTRFTAERNSYYFKVDLEGNQLPYIDRVVYDIVEDREVILLRVMNGEIDFLDRHIGAPANRAVLFDNLERGDYRFIDAPVAQMNTMIIPFNQTSKDPVTREIFQNRDFRIGLSHAINRQELIDLVFIGQGEPWQGAPQREAPFFHERLATQYLEYDPELANEYLDRAFPERDAQGFRLGPDGNRISFAIEADVGGQDRIDMLELIQGYWREVGVDMQVRAMDRGLLWTRMEANEHDVSVWSGDGGLLEGLIRPRYYFPSEAVSAQATAWAMWYLDPNGPLAEEPPAPERRQMELYDEIRRTGDLERQIELMNEILEIAAEEFQVIGISTMAPAFGIARNDMRNVPERIQQSGGFYPQPAPTNPSQYFFDR
jgi:peptide/nickel transport system substrate-binding protein